MEIIDLRLGERRNEYPQYNLTTAPVFLMGADGKTYESNQYKAVLRAGELAAIVSKRYALFPNEEAIKVGEEVAKELGFKTLEVQYTRGGNMVFASFVSDRFASEVRPGDVVKLGFVVRNSIDGSMGFGIDPFTYRLVCKNGAMVKSREGASLLTRKHLGSIEVFVKSLQKMVSVSLIPQLENLLAFYRNWSQIDLNLRIAKAIAQKIPAKHLPDYIGVERKTHEVSISAKPSVWQTFNDITEAIWHSAADIASKATYTDSLHRVLIQEAVQA